MSVLNLYQIVLSSIGEIVFFQKENWIDNSVSMYELMPQGIKQLPNNSEVYYSFFNPLKSSEPLPEGWMVLFLEAQDPLDAYIKVKSIWHKLNLDKLKKKSDKYIPNIQYGFLTKKKAIIERYPVFKLPIKKDK